MPLEKNFSRIFLYVKNVRWSDQPEARWRSTFDSDVVRRLGRFHNYFLANSLTVISITASEA